MTAEAIRTRDGGLLADHAITHIRMLIASGRLAPGARVNEFEIAQQLGISRGPVREAIRRLSSSGLLVPEPNVGSRVVALDDRYASALYEVREALESLAARLAAERMSEAEKRALAEMLDEHEQAMRASDLDAYPAGSADWDFHLAVLSGARNEVAWRVCGNDLRDLLSLLRARHGSSAGRGRRALQEHRWIADAIVAGHGDLAALLMAEHIRTSRDNVMSMMRRPEAGSQAGRER